jgi:DNA polymerase-3 subunit epsilon
VSLRDLLEPLERPLLGFDLETTGTNKKTARIVEIGLEIMVPGEPTRHFRTLVNPTIPIPPGATAIHHITDDDVKDAPTFAQLAPSLIKGFTDADFVGYNIRFDVERIQQEFGRCGIAWSYEHARLICGHRLWQIAQPRSLEDFARTFMDPDEKDAASSGAHNALGDVRWSTGGVAGLLRAYRSPDEKLPRTVAALHETCWPDWYDAEGKLRWRDGQLCVAFGEHRDTPLSEVPDGYRTFILRKDFSDKVKDAVRLVRAGTPPECPAHLLKRDADSD